MFGIFKKNTKEPILLDEIRPRYIALSRRKKANFDSLADRIHFQLGPAMMMGWDHILDSAIAKRKNANFEVIGPSGTGLVLTWIEGSIEATFQVFVPFQKFESVALIRDQGGLRRPDNLSLSLLSGEAALFILEDAIKH